MWVHNEAAIIRCHWDSTIKCQKHIENVHLKFIKISAANKCILIWNKKHTRNDVDQMIKLVLANMNHYTNTLNDITNIFAESNTKNSVKTIYTGWCTLTRCVMSHCGDCRNERSQERDHLLFGGQVDDDSKK